MTRQHASSRFEKFYDKDGKLKSPLENMRGSEVRRKAEQVSRNAEVASEISS